MSGRNGSPSVFERWVRPVLIGVAIGVIVCILLLLMMAAVVQTVDVPRRATMPLAVIAAAAGAFAAGLMAAAVTGRRGLPVGAVCGLMLFLLILIAGFVRYSGVSGGYALIKLAALLISGSVGGLLGMGLRRKRR